MSNNNRVISNPGRNERETFEKPIPVYKKKGLNPIQTPTMVIESSTHSPVVRNMYTSRRVMVNHGLEQKPIASVFEYDPMAETYDEFVPDPNNPIDDKQQESIEVVSYSMNEEEYLLLVNGNLAYYGPLEYVEEQARQMAFNKHDIYKEVSLDDMVILKKMPIKVGLFVG